MSLKPKLYTSKQYLYKRIIVDKKSLDEIARENDVSMMTIFNWAVKFGLVKNTKAVR
jgi:hypothetical protein